MTVCAQLEQQPFEVLATDTLPVILTVMEPFSLHAVARRWADLEEFFNPDGAFGEASLSWRCSRPLQVRE